MKQFASVGGGDGVVAECEKTVEKCCFVVDSGGTEGRTFIAVGAVDHWEADELLVAHEIAWVSCQEVTCKTLVATL